MLNALQPRGIGMDDVVTEVNSKWELMALPMWQQGSIVLSTPDAMQLRAKLRHDSKVLVPLRALFTACRNTAMRERGDNFLPGTGRQVEYPEHAPSGWCGYFGLDKSDYVSLLRRLFKVLVTGLTVEEVEAAANADWDADRKGRARITGEVFLDSMFELVDQWTDGISSDEYSRFAWSLYEEVSDETSNELVAGLGIVPLQP